MDGDPARFDHRPVLSHADVTTFADSGDLQSALVVGVCDATVTERKSQGSTFRDCVGVPFDRGKLPVVHSVGTDFRNSMNLKWEIDCDQNTVGN